MSAREDLVNGLAEHACCYSEEDAKRMVDAFAHELFEQTKAGNTYHPYTGPAGSGEEPA